MAKKKNLLENNPYSGKPAKCQTQIGKSIQNTLTQQRKKQKGSSTSKATKCSTFIGHKKIFIHFYGVGPLTLLPESHHPTQAPTDAHHVYLITRRTGV